LKLINGVITGRHVIRHGAVIVREFGAAAYWRCCVAILMRRRTTFLECVCRIERAQARAVPPSQRN
jgi:hypothetical protein